MKGAALILFVLLFSAGCGERDAGEDGGAEVADAGDAAVDVSADVDLGPPPFDYCAGLPPDDACFVSRRDPASDAVALAERIADHLVARHDPAELSWDWGEAVMLVGLAQTARVTGEARYLDFIAAYMDAHIADGYEIATSDTSAPAALAVALIAAGRDTPEYRQVVADALRYYREEALRTPEGGISHFGAVELFGVSLWADSLFMFGNVMTGWGEHAGDAALLDEYATQYAVFADLLQEDAGFFRHAAYSPFEQDDDVYWARANGWIAAAGYDHLRVRRVRGEARPEMAAAAATLIDAVRASQDPESGLWWTVINRGDESYLETSASALFAFAMARAWRYGYLGDEVLPAIAAAMSGVRDRIVDSDDGAPVVTGISGPTNVGRFEYYAGVAVDDDISYGVGAVLLALTETSGLPEP